MNLIAAAAIVGTIYIFLNWFCIPRKKKGKVIKMDDTENFY
jgi:hypothetical protein